MHRPGVELAIFFDHKSDAPTTTLPIEASVFVIKYYKRLVIRKSRMLTAHRVVCCLQFLLIFRKALAGELTEDSGLYDLYRLVTEIDVQKEGIKGAKNFFEAKVSLK